MKNMNKSMREKMVTMYAQKYLENITYRTFNFA